MHQDVRHLAVLALSQDGLTRMKDANVQPHNAEAERFFSIILPLYIPLFLPASERLHGKQGQEISVRVREEGKCLPAEGSF